MGTKPMAKKAITISELRTVCKPMPLEGPELEAFFVETDEARDPHQRTRQRLMMALETEPARLLFYGHPGCGKSTELNKFLAERTKQFLPVKFSVLDEMTPSNVMAEDLVLVITERVLNAAQRAGLKADERILRGVYDYFAETTKKRKTSHGGSLKAGAGVNTSRSYLGKLIGLFVRFSGEIKVDSYSEETRVFTLRKRPAELLAQANKVIEAVRKGLPKGQRLLVVVEDIDKLDLKQAREMYVNNVNLLTGLAADVIYTIPIYLFHSPDVNAFRHHFDDVIALPMIKVCEPGKDKVPGFDTAKRIVLERIEQSLIEDGALDLLIKKTGGVLRHAFDVLHIVATMSGVAAPISEKHVRYGLDKLRQTCWQQIALPADPLPEGPKSVNELFDRLAEYAKKQVRGKKQLPVSDSINQVLLKCCALVEYNGKGWFGVHPLVIENLRTLGRLSDDAR